MRSQSYCVDIPEDTWSRIIDIFKKKSHFALIDCAYLGLASGSVEKDAFGIRAFYKSGLPFCICQSYAKVMSLYCERVGTLSLVTSSKTEADNVESQIKVIVRSIYSSCPAYGANVASHVLNNEDIKKLWLEEIKEMAERLKRVRQNLYDKLSQRTSRNLEHIIKQKGMFCYSGLTRKETEMLEEKGIFMTRSGRISVAGLNDNNIDYFVDSVIEVIENSKK